MMPPRSMTMAGAWPSSTPMSPSLAGMTTMSTGRDSSSFSGLTISRFTGMAKPSPSPQPPPARGGGGLAHYPSCRCLQAFGFLHGVLDRADHVEGGLREVVVFAGADRLEAAD